MRLRSPLFAPGDSARKIEKAVASAADAVIIDLEDSVAASAKEASRPAVAGAVRANRGRDIIVRVNPRGTQWYLGDLAVVIPSRPGAILLPKCTGAADLRALDHHMEALEAASGFEIGSIKVIALVTETAPSLFTLGQYAGVANRLVALGFGAEDISGDLGVPPRRADGAYPAPVVAARAATLAAAAAAGIVAIDTPWTDFRDPGGLRAEAENAVADGFVGKFLIHPDQIEITNAVFSPSAEQLDWARRVRDAFAQNPDAGVFALDGKMIDRPHLRLATRILAAAEPANAKSAEA